MNILLVNDDGFDSPLLHILCKACCQRGHHVTVCAPHTQQSAKSHSFNIFTPLLVHPSAMEGAASAYRVEGTPVDACRLGMLQLCDAQPDLVISGINFGCNAGLVTFVSGTVGAAREAAFHEYPAMAVSVHEKASPHACMAFADYAVKTGEKYGSASCPPWTVLNLNYPSRAPEEIAGVRVCDISLNVYHAGYQKSVSPRGQLYFWLSAEVPDEHPTPGSDVDLLSQGYITMSFLAPRGCRQEDYAAFPLPWRK